MVTEPAGSKIVVLNPVAAALPADVKLAPRPESLNGKVLGLLNNSKVNAEALLDQIADLLADRYEFANIVKRSKPTASRPCPLRRSGRRNFGWERRFCPSSPVGPPYSHRAQRRSPRRPPADSCWASARPRT